MGKRLKTDLKKQKEKIKLFEGLPNEIKGAITELYSNREAAVDGCHGVVDYHENLIKLRVVGGILTFVGESLCIEELSLGAARITGKISSIQVDMK